MYNKSIQILANFALSQTINDPAVSLDKLKLSKRLHASMNDLGYFTATEFQLKSLSRIIGGHDIIGIAPEGAGKTTAYVLGVLMRLKHTMDEAPKVLVLAANEDRIDVIVDHFKTVSKNKNLHIMALKASENMEDEIEGLVLGVDIVVATPSRARAVYLKLGLNLNRIQTFVIDNAQGLIKQGMQTQVRELAQSCGKVQYLTFNTEENDKLHSMIDDFMPFATVIQVEESEKGATETHELMLYQTPDVDTKIKLLSTLISDDEVFDKVVVFVNSKITAHDLIERLRLPKGEAAILLPLSSDTLGIDDINSFKRIPKCRLLIIANENSKAFDLKGIPFIFHFELPEKEEIFIQQIRKTTSDEAIAIAFATANELPILHKAELSLGKKIPIIPLPDDIPL